MMNAYVSITEEGISPNIANHQKLKAKILLYICKVLRWFLILFSSLQSRPNAYIDYFALFENQKEPSLLSDKGKWWSGEKSDILECLQTSSCDVSMEIGDAAAIVHIWPEPSKLQTLNNT